MLDDISMETTAQGTHLYVGIMDECAAPMHKYLYFTVLLKTDRKPLFKPNWQEHSHAEHTDSDPRCLTAAEKHQIAFLIHEEPRPLPHLPLPAILPTGCLTYPKADVQYFTNISYNQAQLLSRTNKVDEGWSHSVSEEQQCLCSTVGWELWDHNTLKLRQCIFSRVIKFKGSTKLFTYKAFQQALGAFSFGAPYVCRQFCIQTFGKWLQGLDLLCRFGDPISLCTAASCISNLCPIPYAAAIPLLHSKAPKSALEQPHRQHGMSRLSAKEIWQLKWLTSAVSMGRRK